MVKIFVFYTGMICVNTIMPRFNFATQAIMYKFAVANRYNSNKLLIKTKNNV